MVGSPRQKDHEPKESLWERVEDARLRWLPAHSRVTKINADNSSVPNVDGGFAYNHAIHVEALAVKDSLHALLEFKAAVALTPASQAIPEVKPAPEPADSRARVTPRERQVLALIASGKSSRQIAAHLCIAFKTVVVHRYHLQTKLEAHNTAELTKAALRMGLIEL